MAPAQGHTAICIVFDATKKAATIAVCREERTRNVAGLIFIAESEESIVLLAELLIDANVEIVTAFRSHRVGNKVESQRIHIGERKQIGEGSGKRIEHVRRDNIQRLA